MSTMTLKSSSVYSELHSLPLFKSMGDMLARVKDSSRLASVGLTVLEYSCTSVLETLYDGSSVAKGVDAVAGKGMATLIHRYPSLSKSPEEIQESTSSVLKRTVRRAMTTTPGQTILKGLDWAIDKAEGLLRKVKPTRPRSPRKKKLTRAAIHKQHLSNEHAYALDDSGACDSDTRLARPAPGAIPAAVDKLTLMRQLLQELSHLGLHYLQAGADQGLLRKVFTLMCVIPLETSVELMKSTRRFAGGRRKKKTPNGIEHSPGGRRKVSPKKKMPSSLFGKLKNRAIGLLGYPGIGKRISLEQLTDQNTSPIKSEDDDEKAAEKKRKHDEILTDPDSDSSEDMTNFDFDAYDSENDPDYQPTDESGSSSDGMSECDSESEVETETYELKSGHVMVQLKEAKCDSKEKKDLDVGKEQKDIQTAAPAPKKPDDPKPGNIDNKKSGEQQPPISKELPKKAEPPKVNGESIRPEDLNLRPNSKYAVGHPV